MASKTATIKTSNKLKNFFYLFVKRLFDIYCAIIGMIILLPLAIFVKNSFKLAINTHLLTHQV